MRLRSVALVLGFFAFTAALALRGEESPTSIFSEFDEYQGKFTRTDMDRRLAGTMVKGASLADYFELSKTHFLLYASPQDKKDGVVEFELKLRPEEEKGAHPGERLPLDLKGLRVAIDPGHLGGKYARTEARYIDMKPELVGGQEVKFDEGTLTVLTARYLRGRLEKKGVDVMLTRELPGEAVYPVAFEDWSKDTAQFEKSLDFELSRIQDSKRREAMEARWRKVPFLLYNRIDIRERSAKINKFKPDLTVVIHYNAGGKNDPATGQNLGTNRNFNMVFVPGSFDNGELMDLEQRFHFVRLLLSNEIHRSIELSALVAKQTALKTDVPLAKVDEEAAPYLKTFCHTTAHEGVYCRNLGVLSWARGPIAYGETLCQDHFGECLKLNDRTVDVDGFKTSRRVLEVGDAYYDAILEYAK